MRTIGIVLLHGAATAAVAAGVIALAAAVGGASLDLPVAAVIVGALALGAMAMAAWRRRPGRAVQGVICGL